MLSSLGEAPAHFAELAVNVCGYLQRGPMGKHRRGLSWSNTASAVFSGSRTSISPQRAGQYSNYSALQRDQVQNAVEVVHIRFAERST